MENIEHLIIEAKELCKCPVNWADLPAFNPEDSDLTAPLNLEWVRVYREVCACGSDAHILASIAMGRFYELDELDFSEADLTNLRERIPRARDIYKSGIGRLETVRFITPSEQQKHYLPHGPRCRKGVSHFYTDYSVRDLWAFFWAWFGAVLQLEYETTSDSFPKFQFDHARPFWDELCSGNNFRVAIYVNADVGEKEGRILRHICLDIGLGGSIGHAYPVTEDEANDINSPLHTPPTPINNIYGGPNY